MQFNTLWTGLGYYSLENCLIDITASGVDINSVIVGTYEGGIYRVDYHIKTNPGWETEYVQITSRYSNREQYYRLTSDGAGNWIVDGRRIDQFDGCIDVDIAVTPFTNTLPINRLRLQTRETKHIRVIYFDLLQQQVRPVDQVYKRISEEKYHYENVPNDFEADITVDENGLVVDYPSLFTRTEIVHSGYYCNVEQDF